MKKDLKYIVLINLLSIYPVQAAEDFLKTAIKAGLCYGGIFGLYYTLMKRVPDTVESMFEENPDKYKVTDTSLLNLIQQEVQRRGFDFSKFIIVKNIAPGMGIISPTGSVKYILNIGSDEFLKEFSEMNSESQRAVIQHELNHAIYKHLAKQTSVSAISNYVGFLVAYAALLIAANYIEQNGPESGSIFSWIPHKVQSLFSAGLGVYAGRCLDKQCAPVYSRYCEKQADLAIDDDPVIINGLIKFLQAYHDRKVTQHEKDFSTQNSEQIFGKNHPTPLERISYLKEKLQRCSDSKS